MLISKYQMQKIALGIEYNGSRYCGWQHQHNLLSVQNKLEYALSKIANYPINVFCAGRTDAGVHSTGQVVHFVSNVYRKFTAWTYGVNANLPNDISVRWAKIVPDKFHARFSATARSYCYIICNSKIRPALLNKRVTHFYCYLDDKKMHRAAQYLVGENDFTSFRAIKCQSHTPWRNIINLSVKRQKSYILIDIKANSFVYHMVRNIVGSLIEIGRGNRPESWIKTLLKEKNRSLASATAKADGLYLVSIDYPSYFHLPKSYLRPLFLYYN